MTTSELRLGNVIQDLTGNLCTVRAITEGGISIKGGGYSASIEMFSPVELTEELLLKCEFKKRNGYGLSTNALKFIAVKVADDIGFHFKSTDVNVEIKYLHQLQNLIHSLTNKELEICF